MLTLLSEPSGTIRSCYYSTISYTHTHSIHQVVVNIFTICKEPPQLEVKRSILPSSFRFSLLPKIMRFPGNRRAGRQHKNFERLNP